jgi:hypothetical protein
MHINRRILIQGINLTKKRIMKKLGLIAVCLFAMAILISSCKTRELCPAYSKVEKAKPAKQI